MAELTDLEKQTARAFGMTYDEYADALAGPPVTDEQRDSDILTEAKLIIEAVSGGGTLISLQQRRALREVYAGRNVLADDWMAHNPLPEESETQST